MNREELREILNNNIKIVNHYGVKAQIPVWIEEMSELTKVLCKWARKYDQLEGDLNMQLLNDMKEEITDVTVCIDQLRYIINYAEDELLDNYKSKVNRQLARISGEDYE